MGATRVLPRLRECLRTLSDKWPCSDAEGFVESEGLESRVGADSVGATHVLSKPCEWLHSPRQTEGFVCTLKLKTMRRADAKIFSCWCVCLGIDMVQLTSCYKYIIYFGFTELKVARYATSCTPLRNNW